MFKLLIIGPPASGKTTLAKALAHIYKCDYVSSGEFARSLQTPANIAALAVGDLSPDHMAIAEWVTRKVNEKENIIIDGYPRSREQYDCFDFQKVSAVIWLDVPVGECMSRALNRNRSDDDSKVFWNRYMNYMKHTGPLMMEFAQSNKVSFIHLVDPCKGSEDLIELATQALLQTVGA